ncbi:MAG: protein TolR [Gammaproteobacteria bacterium]
MNRRHKRKKLMSEINVVPYIDVMLVLLIIFMITTPLLNQGVNVELPKISSKPVNPDQADPIRVDVDRDGHLHYDGETITPDDLQQRISVIVNANPEVKVYVGGDKDVAYGQVIAAMVLLQEAGVPSVGLLTEPPENANPASAN